MLWAGASPTGRGADLVVVGYLPAGRGALARRRSAARMASPHVTDAAEGAQSRGLAQIKSTTISGERI